MGKKKLEDMCFDFDRFDIKCELNLFLFMLEALDHGRLLSCYAPELSPLFITCNNIHIIHLL